MAGSASATAAARRRLRRLHAELRPRGAAAAPQLELADDAHSGEQLSRGLTASQVAHYKEFGFVVLRRLYEPAEVSALRSEFDHLLKHCPAERGSPVDNFGGPIPGSPGNYNFTDPVSGDDPRTFNSSTEVLNRVNGCMHFCEACRTAYGSSRLLSSAESIYGRDFLPFGISYVLKPPHHGAGFSWHQDTGVSVDFPYDWQEERGINFGCYLHPSNVENGCLHVLPRSHLTKKDMEELVPDGRGSMIPGAIAVPVEPGDAIVHARNVVHGSFPNKSDSTRCTLYFGFHPMASVAPYYDEETIRDQQRMLPLAVALRRCRKPDEKPFEYRGLGDDEPFLDLCRQAQSESELAEHMHLLDAGQNPQLQI